MALTGSVPVLPEEDRTLRRVLFALWALAIVSMVAGELFVLAHLRSADGPYYSYWLEPMISAAFFVLVGMLIHAKRPRHHIGHVFLFISFAAGTQTLAGGYAHFALWAQAGELPLGAAAALVSTVAQLGFVMGLVALLYLFPDGRLASPRWRWPAAAAVIGFGFEVLRSTTAPGKLDIGGVANPLGSPAIGSAIDWLAPIATVLFIAGLVGAVIGPFLRYRSAEMEVRLQLRWFAYGAVVAIAFIVVTPERLGAIAWGVGPGILPLAVGIAILRYRLYDIDRVIRRTLSYTILVALLLAVYVGVTMALGALLRTFTGEAESDLLVAGSTLLVAALFRPLGRRVRAGVDRRFDRGRFDTAEAIAWLTGRLRDEVDLDAIVADLEGLVSERIRPRTVSVWMRSAQEPS